MIRIIQLSVYVEVILHQFLRSAEFISFLFTAVYKHWFMRLVYAPLNTNLMCVCLVNVSSALVSVQVKKSHSESHVPDPSDTR